MKKKNDKGFTMIELVAVLAIMGIIGALLVPSFNTMVDKAKLTTDIATVKTLQRTAEVYKAETGSFPISIDILKTTKYITEEPKYQLGTGYEISDEVIYLKVDAKDCTAYKAWCTSDSDKELVGCKLACDGSTHPTP